MKRLFIALLISVLLAGPHPAMGQVCPSGVCPSERPFPSQQANPAVVRVANVTANGNRYYGSGTLVHKDAKQAIVLTCAHVFHRGVGQVTVIFPDGRRFEAGVLEMDRAWDLAALWLAPPQASPVTIGGEPPRPGDRLQNCGYGPDGRYRCTQGQALGYAKTDTTTTYETLRWSGTARDGDSGGPAFNERGELVAVLWGTTGRTVGGTYCGRIRKFLRTILDRLLGAQPSPPIPSPLPVDPGSIGAMLPGAPPTLADHLDKIRVRLDALDAEVKAIKGQQGTGVADVGRQLEHNVDLIGALSGRIQATEEIVGEDNLRGKIREIAKGIVVEHGPTALEAAIPAAIPGLLAALGWTGPPALALIVGLKLFSRILQGKTLVQRIRRRRKNRRNSADKAEEDDPPATSTPSTVRPMFDDYAKQLAEVHSLSGRSAWGDVTLGREYDRELREAEQSSDGKLASWAAKIRRRVGDRFNRIHSKSPVPGEPIAGET